jgi:rSAM/selenodomain-associated transferase 1
MNQPLSDKLPRALLVVAKRPAAGQTKTRLTPYLSPEMAAALYECFLKDTIALMRQVPGVRNVLAYLPAGEEPYFRRLAPDFELILQDGHDLGSRLDNATTGYLQMGYKQVVIMDSDSPTLPLSYLEGAFSALEGGADLVLGPCDDGGYYLIGMKRPVPRLLREVRMSTPSVVAETLELAALEGLGVHLLPEWYDVDNGEELTRLRDELARRSLDSVAVHTRRYLEQNKPPAWRED